MLKKSLLFIFLVLFTLSGCLDTQKEARTLLSSAVTDWKLGDINSAVEKFTRLQNEFAETELAQVSAELQEMLLEGYKAQFYPKLAAAKNSKPFGRMVVREIKNYLMDNGEFPPTIQHIRIPGRGTENYQDLLSLCDYQRAVNNWGYKLDCSGAEVSYQKKQEEKRAARNADRMIAKAIKKGTYIQKITDFPKAGSTWGETFYPGGKIPAKGFQVFYFNTNNPKSVIASDRVDAIAVNYIYDKFNNIESQDFGAYWVGSINIEEEKTIRIAVSQSRAKCRLIIDGAIIFEGKSDKEILLSLEKGSHKVEVEYVNNWHTTDFSVSFLESQIELSDPEIASTLHTLGSNYQLYNVAVYESKNMDHSITLNLKKTDKPVVLFLSSYNAVKWVVSNPHKVEIHAIVQGAYKPGTTVTGDIDKKTLHLVSKKRISNYSMSARCSCHGAHFHCEGKNGLATIRKIEQIGRAKVTGFSGKYSTTALDLPEQVVDKNFIASLQQEKKDDELLRRQCNQKKNPNFEKMLKTQ